ncbi:tyrosine-type recombinase/integrase [Myxococcus xanthus]|uniref:tyrosine-type recombinase/integrase n=1 Tax=Myxococcus xanthus TaxID=34 RepID=UPI00112E02DC|nr:hypothetical protein [Myxococcus xanthus]QDE83363.1 hypothetical protein BHS07_18345 [Myxococcus xanthus]
MARVYFRYAKGVLADLAKKYGEPTRKLVQRLQAREAAGEKIVWPREEAPKNGTWWLDYRNAAGARTYASTKATTKGEAEVKLRERLASTEDIKAGRAPAHRGERPMDIESVAEKVLAAKAGLPSYEADLSTFKNHVIPAFGRKFLAEVTAAEVDEFVQAKLRAGYQHGTVKQMLQRLSSCYTWARKARVYYGPNPLEDADGVVVPGRSPKSLTEAQLDRFLEVAGPWTLLFQVAGILGPRKGELCGLQWRDFVEDFQFPDGEVGPALHIQRSYATPYPKGKKERIVPVPQDIAEALRKARETATSRWIFPNSRGRMRKSYFKPVPIFLRCCVDAGIVSGWAVKCECGYEAELPEKRSVTCPTCDVLLVPRGIPPDMTFRHLRSTAATRLGDVRQAQELLGHAALATTARHYVAGNLSAVRDTLNNRATRRTARSQRRDKHGTLDVPAGPSSSRSAAKAQ